MLSPSHNRAYQDFLTLLTEFKGFLIDCDTITSPAEIKQRFQHVCSWFEQHVANLTKEDLEIEIAPRWQAVQTDIKREFKLLSTDILFLAAARQNHTQTKRLKSIINRLTKIIGYCRVILKDRD